MMEYDDKVGMKPDLLSYLKEQALDLLFPVECLLCSKEGEWLCADCLGLLLPLPRQGCIFCGSENLSGRTCQNCRRIKSLDGCFSAGNYGQKEVSLLIKRFKYSFIPCLSTSLAEFVAKSIHRHRSERDAGLFPGKWHSCPIPLSQRRKNWRGFNQSELIAGALEECLNWKRCVGLKRNRNNRPQAKLGNEERRSNIAGCFTYEGSPLSENKIVLIDDVATTGATMEEAAKTLKAAGARSVWGLVIAKG